MSESGPGGPSSDSAPSDKDVWVCRDCGKEYGSGQGLTGHYKRTECNGHECPECGADHFKTPRGVVMHSSREHGTEGSYYDDRIADREWFYQKYVMEGNTTTDIAEIIGCSEPQARAWKRKHDIQSIGAYKSRGTGEDNPTYTPGSRVETECAYCGDDIEIPRQRHERHPRNFCNNECQNQHKSEYWVGENNPLFKGGQHYYGAEWREIRKKVRGRDDHTCQRCGVHESELDRELDVHHLKPFREFEDRADAHAMDNLVSYCRSCHQSWEGIPLRPDGRDT